MESMRMASWRSRGLLRTSWSKITTVSAVSTTSFVIRFSNTLAFFFARKTGISSTGSVAGNDSSRSGEDMVN